MNKLDQSIKLIIDELLRSRMCPKFQFERASETFLIPFLEEWLGSESILRHKVQLATVEFPLKKPENNQSTNTDFLFLSTEPRWYLVELKTERAALREKQNKAYMDAISKKNFAVLLDDVRRIHDASKKQEKYSHVIGRVSRFGKEDSPLSAVFITPDEQRPNKLPPQIQWFGLHQFFEEFQSKRHPALWAQVRRLKDAI